MIYLYLIGNCGNQMFQYSFARYVSEITKEEITFCWESEEDEKKRNQLKYFNICDVKNLFEHKKNWKRTIFFKLRGILRKDESGTDFEYKYADFFAKYGIIHLFRGYHKFNINKKGDKYIQGYFQSPRYFEKIENIVRKELTPKLPILSKNEEILKLINDTESVCITIRRGDFFEPEYSEQFAICDEDYFYRAVSVIESKVKNPVYFIFSDEIEWVRENMRFKGEIYYENGNDTIYEKIRLMSACKNFIISNSTFSWWAQYLSVNKEKVVVAPGIWRRDDGLASVIYEKSWNLVEIEKK